MKILWGKVKLGAKRGKKLGFPTANFNLHQKIPHGIYVSETKINKEIFPSLTFIGNAITFNEKKSFAETYILNSNFNLYDKWISVKLIKNIRENQKFNSVDELIKQIKKDELIAKEYFNLK